MRTPLALVAGPAGDAGAAVAERVGYDEPGAVLALWLESAGGGLRVGHAGPWLAAVEDWSGVDAERRATASLHRDPHYGDRAQDLVVIAHLAAPDEIVTALRGAADRRGAGAGLRTAPRRPVRRVARGPVRRRGGRRPRAHHREGRAVKPGIHPDHHPWCSRTPRRARRSRRGGRPPRRASSRSPRPTVARCGCRAVSWPHTAAACCDQSTADGHTGPIRVTSPSGEVTRPPGSAARRPSGSRRGTCSSAAPGRAGPA